MNQEEFRVTLNYSLDFIQLSASSEEIRNLFDQIDLDHDGWISYEVYFFFLKYYFGSLSAAAKKPNFKIEHKTGNFLLTIGTLTQDVNLMSSVNKLQVIERFAKLIMDQLQ